MRDVALSPGIPQGKWARLRPLCGRDEILVDGSGAANRTAFIDGLLTEVPGTAVKPGCVPDLALCDCDRLCASIYIDCFGEIVEGRVTCYRCSQPFEMRFSLVDLMEHVTNRVRDAEKPDIRGLFTTPDGRRFRLPTVQDQQEIAGLDVDTATAALRARCLVDGDAAAAPEELDSIMERVGPMLDADLDAVCPHCGVAQAVRFDIQSYLFRALGYEKQFLLYEVHRIATAYGWRYDETLGLTREDRRKLVRLIESERLPRRRKQ